MWPAEFDDAEYLVSTERGLLWFDTIGELRELSTEAEVLLNEVPQE